MGILVSDLIRRGSTLMSDADMVRWEEAEHIDWINDGAREIVMRRPAARSVLKRLTLVAGTYQSAPDGVTQVLNVVRNVVASAPSSIIRITDSQQLDDADPDWHTSAPGLTMNFAMDERSPTNFWVYPQAVASAQVDALCAEVPPAVVEPTDTLDLRQEFINAIVDWMLYRFHIKDSEYANGAVASIHYQAFTDAIGAPAQIAQVNSANGNSV